MTFREVRLVFFLFLLLGALAVILGAFGAHALESKINTAQLSSYKTGVQYQFIHVLAGLIFLLLAHSTGDKGMLTAAYFLLAGILCFSGSIYLLSLKEILGIESMSKILGPITPLGGLLFILGWLWAAWRIWQISEHL